MEQLQGYNQLIRRASSAPSRIHYLRLHGANYQCDDPLVLKSLRERSNAPGDLIPALFSHIAPFGPGEALQLHSLSLHNQGLRHADAHILPLIDWSGLKSLDIEACLGQEQFFSRLSESYLKPGPYRLHEFKFLSYKGEEGTGGIDTNLSRCHDLRHLVLQYQSRSGTQPSWSAIMQNRTQLQSLAISVSGVDPRPTVSTVLDLAKLKQLSLEVPNLSELAIGYPGVAFVMGHESLDAELLLHLETAASIPPLRALRILNWPSVPAKTDAVDEVLITDNDGTKLCYQHILERFASRVLNLIDGTRKRQQFPALKVLCIGEPEHDATFYVGETEWSWQPSHPKAYVPK